MSTEPFSERGGKARGCLDLVSGRFPAFVFGGGVGALLPVFHFHDVTRDELEPQLRHLADNGYRSVISDEIAAYVRGELTLPARSVGLCFDDAWKSVATVAAPLLTTARVDGDYLRHSGPHHRETARAIRRS